MKKIILGLFSVVALAACEPSMEYIGSDTMPDGTTVAHYRKSDGWRSYDIFIAEKNGFRSTTENHMEQHGKTRSNHSSVTIEEK